MDCPFSMYTEILSYIRVTHICWMENNPDGHLLKVVVCLFLYLESNQVITLKKVSKRNKKGWKPNVFFSFFTNFAWILYTVTNLLFYLIQLRISDETNEPPQDSMCNYIGRNKQFYFLGLTLPKNGFRFWNLEN